MPVWTPVVCSGYGSGKRQGSGQRLNERYTRRRDLREAIGCVFGIFPIAFLTAEPPKAHLYGRRGHTCRSWRPTRLNSTGSIW